MAYIPFPIVTGQTSGGGGSSVHNDLAGRSAADAHPTSAITGLGTAAVADTGTGAANVIVGSDARLTDARTPTAHTHSGADITSGTVATARLGSGTANATTFLRGDQTWAAPTGGSDGYSQSFLLGGM